MTTDLTKTVSRNVLWSGVASFSTYGISFVATVVLARLLLPADFGLMGMANVFIGLVALVSELGLGAALIQKPALDEGDLCTVFWVNLAAGVAFFFGTVMLAPLVSVFFHEARLQPLLSAWGLGFILGAPSVVPRALLQRAFKFREVALTEMMAVMLYGLVAVCLALAGAGVWSLVAGVLIQRLAASMALLSISGWWPTAAVELTGMRGLFSFGLNVAGSRLLNYFISNLDYAVIGRFIGAEALGYYALAFQLVMFPLGRISRAVTEVAFPTFSRLQDHPERFARSYLKMLRYISVFTFPMVLGLLVVAEPFILLVYGPHWRETAHLVRILCLTALVSSVGTTSGSVLKSLGRADLEFKLALPAFLLMAVAVLIGSRLGVVGVAIGVSVGTSFIFLMNQVVVNAKAKITMGEYVHALFPPLVSSGLMALSVMAYWMLATSQTPTSLTGSLIGAIGLAGAVYLVLMRCIMPTTLREMQRLVSPGTIPDVTAK